MQRVLIVNNNLDMGGIQKSLVNLLKGLNDDNEYTLLLFSKTGALLKDIPNDIKVITPNTIYQLLGLSREQLKKKPIYYFIKVLLVYICKIVGKRNAIRLMGLFQKKIKGYDTVISYSHLTSASSFSNGCAEFVLDKTEAKNKICFLHCDYEHSGTCSDTNSKTYAEFDKIACCSESVKERFLRCSLVSPDKVFVQRNFFDDDIYISSVKNPVAYDKEYINMLIVARLSFEKGIDRALSALADSQRQDIIIHIVGDGPEKSNLIQIVHDRRLANNVVFHGEQSNPYRFMINADYLLVPSRHEAAPIVFDEAKVLGLPVISTNTTSAYEMLDDRSLISNDLQEILKRIQKNKGKIILKVDNKLQLQQWHLLLD